MKAIWDSIAYIQELKSNYLLRFYYLISWKKYLKKENIWEPFSLIQYLKKLIRSFYKNYSDKLIVIFEAIDTALLIVKPTIRPTVKPIKQKKCQSANTTNNQAKKT